MYKHNILFVDDEINILKSLRRVFRGEKYNIFTATDGKAGLDIIREKNISLVVSDQRMPSMSGVEFLNEVKKMSPQTMRVMLTGYADKKATLEAINTGEVYRFVTKPWDDLEIKIIIDQAIRQYKLVENNKKLNELTKTQNYELQELNLSLEKKVEERTHIISQKKDELERVYKELERNFFDSIRVFVGILELYNPVLGNHSKRTAALARMMAANEELSEKDVETVEIAAMLHDVGMVGMPKEISDAKPFNLQGENLKMYEKHPVIGQSIIKHIKKLDPIGRIIRSHHERFDGAGYPDGLKGEHIPVHSRIIAVADFYDEISVFGLPESGERDPKAIIEFIKISSGKMFDPRMVQSLTRVLKEIKGKLKNEIEVSAENLTGGMVISRDIRTVTGILLVTKGTTLNETYVTEVKNYRKIGYIKNKIYIYSLGGTK